MSEVAISDRNMTKLLFKKYEFPPKVPKTPIISMGWIEEPTICFNTIEYDRWDEPTHPAVRELEERGHGISANCDKLVLLYVGGKLGGYAQMNHEKQYLINLLVFKEHRRRGYGSLLYKEAVKPYEKVTFICHKKMEEWYRKLGAIKNEEYIWKIWGLPEYIPMIHELKK
jgi:GNAT superfamily N-acetyltransferase